MNDVVAGRLVLVWHTLQNLTPELWVNSTIGIHERFKLPLNYLTVLLCEGLIASFDVFKNQLVLLTVSTLVCFDSCGNQLAVLDVQDIYQLANVPVFLLEVEHL